MPKACKHLGELRRGRRHLQPAARRQYPTIHVPPLTPCRGGSSTRDARFVQADPKRSQPVYGPACGKPAFRLRAWPTSVCPSRDKAGVAGRQPPGTPHTAPAAPSDAAETATDAVPSALTPLLQCPMLKPRFPPGCLPVSRSGCRGHCAIDDQHRRPRPAPSLVGRQIAWGQQKPTFAMIPTLACAGPARRVAGPGYKALRPANQWRPSTAAKSCTRQQRRQPLRPPTALSTLGPGPRSDVTVDQHCSSCT